MAAYDHSEDHRERERRRVARIMQEKAENEKELQEALYKWDMRMVANGPCIIFPGDYVAVGHGCMCSSRGALVDLDMDDIRDMIGVGGLHQVFDFDDLNAPDFYEQVDDIMARIAAQRMYQDASRYRCSGSLRQAVAEYDLPAEPGQDGKPATAAVERNGSVFVFRAGAGAGDVPMRQCSYDEFNPGGVDIRQALYESAKPEQGRSQKSAWQELQEKYLADGENDIAKPSDASRRIPGYDRMTPSEKLAVQVRLEDEQHKAMQRSAGQEHGPDAADQWGPRMPGERRYPS